MIKRLFLLITAAITLFTSCSKQDNKGWKEGFAKEIANTYSVHASTIGEQDIVLSTLKTDVILKEVGENKVDAVFSNLDIFGTKVSNILISDINISKTGSKYSLTFADQSPKALAGVTIKLVGWELESNSINCNITALKSDGSSQEQKISITTSAPAEDLAIGIDDNISNILEIAVPENPTSYIQTTISLKRDGVNSVAMTINNLSMTAGSTMNTPLQKRANC